jgi:DNA-binding response OmpR family regulator
MADKSAPPPSPLVLLVDDARDDLEMYSIALTSQGFRTCRTDDIETALQIAPAADIVVTDLHLPGLDGLVLLDSLWAELRTREIPVIVLTADGTRETRKKVLTFRPAEFHVKPLTPELLVAAVRRVLATENQPTALG